MRKEEREFRRQNSECRMMKGDCHPFDCSLDAARDMAQGRVRANRGVVGEVISNIEHRILNAEVEAAASICSSE